MGETQQEMEPTKDILFKTFRIQLCRLHYLRLVITWVINTVITDVISSALKLIFEDKPYHGKVVLIYDNQNMFYI